MAYRGIFAGLTVLFLAMALAGCRSAPIHNVKSAPIPATAEVENLKEVTKAIQRAGIGLGWKMRVKEPGHIIGTLDIRSHQAVVDIKYSKSGYDITYKDSSNLEHSGDKIHSNYNDWVRNLDRDIQKELLSS